MKKSKLLLCGVFLLAGALAAMTGCELGGASTYRNPYEVATNTGTEGSAGEWLAGNTAAPTEARRMYEEACADGYGGTYLDFLKELGFGDSSAAVSTALLSTVSVVATFERSGSDRGEQAKYASIGSGVIYDLDTEKGNAYIITNYHVVCSTAEAISANAKCISDDVHIYLYGGEYAETAIPVSYVGGSMNYDIAVLRAENNTILKESDARPLTPADSDAISVGQRVYAIGNADGARLSAVEGIVSVDAEYIDGVLAADGVTELDMLEIRTDAAVNHGNSGGGLYNEDGALVGIVNARSEKDGVLHFGYAIPSNLALAVAQNVIDNSKVNRSKGALRATLGVTVQAAQSRGCYDERTGKVYTMETIAVIDITSGSICDGKLKAGDVLYSVRINDGPEKIITRLHMLGNTLFRVRKGDTVTVTVSRGQDVLSVPLTFSSDRDFTEFS